MPTKTTATPPKPSNGGSPLQAMTMTTLHTADRSATQKNEWSPKTTVGNVIAAIKKTRPRSQWDRGVKEYALELLESAYDDNAQELLLGFFEAEILQGATKDWQEYSEGGMSLIYDRDICARLANPTEKKRSRNGELPPNKKENWIQCQARALYQAARLIRWTILEVSKPTTK